MAGKKLITESDVRAMAPGGELVLGSDTIATPAALDLAFQRGMRVVRDLEAGGGGGGHDCLWHRMLEVDGDFVVTVRDGKAIVNRMTDSGPVEFGRDDRRGHGR